MVDDGDAAVGNARRAASVLESTRNERPPGRPEGAPPESNAPKQGRGAGTNRSPVSAQLAFTNGDGEGNANGAPASRARHAENTSRSRRRRGGAASVRSAASRGNARRRRAHLCGRRRRRRLGRASREQQQRRENDEQRGVPQKPRPDGHLFTSTHLAHLHRLAHGHWRIQRQSSYHCQTGRLQTWRRSRRGTCRARRSVEWNQASRES